MGAFKRQVVAVREAEEQARRGTVAEPPPNPADRNHLLTALDLARVTTRTVIAARDLGQAVAAKFGRRVDEDDE